MKNDSEFQLDGDARKQGYSFSLFAPNGGLQFLNHLGLEEEISPFSFIPKGFRLIDGVAGTKLHFFMNLTSSKGKILLEFDEKIVPAEMSKSRRVLRAPLRKFLVSVCEREGIPVIWNAKFSSYEEKDDSVTIHFENHADENVHILIGGRNIV